MKYEGCYFLAENYQAILAFPNAVIDAHTDNEITIDITPLATDQNPIFDEEYAIQCESTNATFTKTVYEFKYAQYVDSEVIPTSHIHPLTETIKVRKLNDLATLPHRATEDSVG